MLRYLLLLALLMPRLCAGVLATYEQDGVIDSHEVRLPALYVPAEQAATPLLKPGPFKVTFSGSLKVETRQRLYFSFAGSGQVTLTIDGETVHTEEGILGTTKSERLRLNAGEHPFTLAYQSPQEGAAQFRILWEERSFPTEPIPTSAFSGELPSPPLSAAVYRGREIFARHLCIKCHTSNEGLGPHAMPELSHVPPILGLTGQRLKADWIAEWIADPQALRPTSEMPRLVTQDEAGRQEAADLASYLMTLGAEAQEKDEQVMLEGDALAGGALFHQLACVTCHELPNETKPQDAKRLSLARLGDKYQSKALHDYLLKPSQLSPHTRMPNFGLSETEANDLTKYLLESAPEKADKLAEQLMGDPTRGEILAKQKHCGACHAGLPYDPTLAPSFEKIADVSWSSSPCYDSEASHLNLPAGAEDDLEALRKNHLASLKQDTSLSFATRQFKNLRCNACHSHDEEQALLANLHSESASLASHLAAVDRVDQSLPALTFVGEQLHSDYLSQMLSGTVAERPRPWLEARMPAFSSHSPEVFAAGFAAQHGLAPSSPKPGQIDEKLAKIGRALTTSEEGFGCIACHGVGLQEPTAAFEVMGINFDQTHLRLREGFYHQWMNDPTRINPATKMPRYADAKGETALPILEGSAQAQFEALWIYLSEIPTEQKAPSE